MSTLGFKSIAYTDNVTVAISVLHLNTLSSGKCDRIGFIFEKIKEVQLLNEPAFNGTILTFSG